MTVEWPSFLPQAVRRDGYGYKPDDVVARSEMEGGPTLARQRFSEAPTTFSVSLTLTGEQRALFEGWWKYELQRGARPFRLPLLTGTGVAPRRALMLGAPQFDASIGPRKIRVTTSVRVLEPIEMDFVSYYVNAYPSWLDALDHGINVIAPQIWD